MSGLLYRPDFDETRDRLARWWQGEDIGRPALLLTAPRAAPFEEIPVLPEPDGWTGRYSTRDFDYRVNLALRACVHTDYFAEAMPVVSPDLAPNCLALYLGCRGIEGEDTVWCEPCIEDPQRARFDLDPENFYWDFSSRLADMQLRLGKGKFLTAFPDLIEGLDTLAAMRGTEPLLLDLLERPEWVQSSLAQITACYFTVYDRFYERFKDDRGGSHFWAWAPGRMSKLQCDFSAMISAEMFGEFMLPVLEAMTARLDYSMFHWDGPGALPHHDHLLSLGQLNAIQWTPGAAAEPIEDRRWWPLYHKTIDAGKKVVLMSFDGIDNLRTFRKEFGAKFNNFILRMGAESPAHADEILAVASD